MEHLLVVRPFCAGDTEPVVSLWHACGLTRPWNNPYRDIERKLAQQPDLFLVAEIDQQVVGTVMAGYEGHRGWLYYVGVHPAHQRRGIGSALVQRAVEQLRLCGCPKVNLLVREDNPGAEAFYQELGFEAEPVVMMGLRLVDDSSHSTDGCDARREQLRIE
jgi:ribosomal protein S18 acetylase RimI-like enzyme